MPWPLAFEDVLAARERIRPHLSPTPLRHYPALDREVGAGIRVLVKHENHQPTNAFKVRNALAALTAPAPGEVGRGVVAATRGNHGLAVAWAGRVVGAPVTICVPVGNNPEKNEAARGLGARVVEAGADYDDAVAVADRLARDEGLALVHSTNDARVLAGAGTLALEVLEDEPGIDALVAAVGGGSLAVGAMTVTRRLRPSLEVLGAQSAGAPAIHDAWHAGRPLPGRRADTFADGVATRDVYELTFAALREGLAGFVAVPDAAIAEAMRILVRTTHNLVEGAGAVGLAGLLALRERLAGRTVAIVLTGSNVDAGTLRRVLNGEI
jgi:threonine dehydratase